jgi:hypothetical protein
MDQNLCLFREWWERSGRPKSSLGPPPPGPGLKGCQPRIVTSEADLVLLRFAICRRGEHQETTTSYIGPERIRMRMPHPPRPRVRRHRGLLRLPHPRHVLFFHQLRTLTGAIRRPPLKLQERALTRSMYARVRAELAFAIGVRRPR